MVTSNSRFSYSDCFDLMDKALADAKGIRVRFASESAARHFRMRMHTARRLDRSDNLLTYPEGEAMHGRSPYDPLIVRLVYVADGTCWLRIERVDARTFEIESLSEAAPEPELPYEPPPKIPLNVKPMKRRL